MREGLAGLRKRRSAVRTIAVLLPIALLLTSCTTVQLIAYYDETIFNGISKFQRDIETFLTFLERHEGEEESAYEQCTAFYDSTSVALSSIRVHAAAIQKNDITVKQVDLLIESLESLEEMHTEGITTEDITLARSAFNSSCVAILTFENEKKRDSF